MTCRRFVTHFGYCATEIFLVFSQKADGLKREKKAVFEPGTAMIALKNEAPIVPIFIKGEYKIFRRMKMIIGEPIILSEYVGDKSDPPTVAVATKFLAEKLKDLKNTTF